MQVTLMFPLREKTDSSQWGNAPIHLIQRPNTNQIYSKSDPQTASLKTQISSLCDLKRHSSFKRPKSSVWLVFFFLSQTNNTIITDSVGVMLCKKWPGCFSFHPLMVWPSLFLPISLIRHSHTHISWSPFFFSFASHTEWLAAVQDTTKTTMQNKQLSEPGVNHQQTVLTLRTLNSILLQNHVGFKMALHATDTAIVLPSNARVFAFEFNLNPQKEKVENGCCLYSRVYETKFLCF